MKFGYARVSTSGQTTRLQLDALERAGCERIFQEHASAWADRPELDVLLGQLRPGDQLIVWRLDRLGRSMGQLRDLVLTLGERGVDVASLQEHLDTTSPGGMLIFHVLAALAEFERELIRERTRAGLEAARARGRQGGRPKVYDATAAAVARQMYDSRQFPISAIAHQLGVGRTTVYRMLAATEV
jgi:DNA invertase Pin-like site-specific DNA recombinase